MKEFEFFEHTADIGVRAYGDSLESLFINCTTALFKLFVDYDYNPTQISYKNQEVILEAQEYDELLITWLNELISIFFANHFLPIEYKFSIEDKEDIKLLSSQIKGLNFNPYENKIGMEIKAATYHNLKIEKTDTGYLAEVIFDV